MPKVRVLSLRLSENIVKAMKNKAFDEKKTISQLVEDAVRPLLGLTPSTKSASSQGQEHQRGGEEMKPAGFDESFWGWLAEQGIGANTVAGKLTEMGSPVTPEGVRYWKKAKRGIPAEMVDPIRLAFPDFATWSQHDRGASE